MRETIANVQLTKHIDRLMAKTRLGLVDHVDIEAVRQRADSRTPYGWFISWMERAGAARETARETLEHGDVTGASTGYLRASEYFRAAAAVYWPERGDAAVADALRLHGECFRAALDLDGPPYRTFLLDAVQPAINGYLLQPSSASPSGGVLLCSGPPGGTPGEQYVLAGLQAVRRGWWVLLAAPQASRQPDAAWGHADPTPRAISNWLSEVLVEQPARLAVVVLGEDDAPAADLAYLRHDVTDGWLLTTTAELGIDNNICSSGKGYNTCGDLNDGSLPRSIDE